VSVGTVLDDQLCDVVLRDGSTLALRRARHDDVPELLRFFNGLSLESRYYRFFRLARLEPATIERLFPGDPSLGLALVGECGKRIVAFAGFNRAAGADRSPRRAKGTRNRTARAGCPGRSMRWRE